MSSKIINQGLFGCAIEPQLKCKKKYKKGDKLVSKLIDLQDLPEDYVKNLKKETSINEFFAEKDKDRKFLLSAIESCKKKKISKDNIKVLNKCMITTKNPYYLNLIFEKGYDFSDKIKKMSNEDISKTLLYLAEALNFVLNDINIILFDIHDGNILFKKVRNLYHPIFIDFTPDYVKEKKLEEFFNYILEYRHKSDIMKTIISDLLKYGKVLHKNPNPYFYELAVNITELYKKKNKKKFSKFIERYLLKKLGKCFKKSKHYKKNKYILNITKKNLFERYDLDTLIKIIKKELKIKKLEELYIK